MRRALLLVLVATVLVVSAWSAITAAASDAPFEGPAIHASDDGSGVPELGGSDLPEAAAVAPVLSVVPAGRLMLDRGDAVVLACLLVLAALVALDQRATRWLRRAVDGLRPAGAPVLSVAPRRGPPAGLARPFGT